MADLTRCLRRLVSATDPEPDADLLDRFVADRDEAAFAALVRRHGPMVLGVCRRVLRDHHAAEDAFQATFLVLAHRAAALRPRAAVGNWLYGVAYRTALAARRGLLARRAREARAGAMRDTETLPDDGHLADLRAALDRELMALPDICRAAVVACDLEGLSRREAAARLGVAEGTLSSRLARARGLLAKRLRNAGLSVPAAGLGAVAGPAAVGAQLSTSTARLAALVAVGEAVVPAAVAALTEGAMKAMLLTKLKVMTAALVVGCAVLATAAAGWQANAAGVSDPPPADKKAKPVAPPKAGQNKDKDRIAELERERDRLLKELAEARYRMALLEARQAELLAVMRRAELGRRKVEDSRAAAVPAMPTAAGASVLGTTAPAIAPGDLTPPPATPGAALPPTPALGPSVNRPPEPTAPDLPLIPPPGVSDSPAATPPGVSVPPVPQPGQVGPTPPRPRPTVHVYPVGDLVPDEKEGEALCKVVRAAVVPKSWGADAGVEYLPGKKVLVVRQTAEGHDEVVKLLYQLKAQEGPAGRK